MSPARRSCGPPSIPLSSGSRPTPPGGFARPQASWNSWCRGEIRRYREEHRRKRGEQTGLDTLVVHAVDDERNSPDKEFAWRSRPSSPELLVGRHVSRQPWVFSRGRATVSGSGRATFRRRAFGGWRVAVVAPMASRLVIGLVHSHGGGFRAPSGGMEHATMHPGGRGLRGRRIAPFFDPAGSQI